MKNLQVVTPANRVEGFGDVKLDEEARNIRSMKLLDQVLHVEEIVMYASPLYRIS
jgi:hypothetical protein